MVHRLFAALAILTLGIVPARAQVLPPPAQPAKPTFDIYGFAMLDIGHNFTQIHPDWYDTLRVTRLPKVEKEFGEDNSTFAGVRQSRLGFKSTTPTDYGDLKTTFEFELFGTGVDAGQTTFRLRHAWGELGTFDLSSATNKLDIAERVHDCFGRLLADLVIAAAKPEETPTNGSR